MYPTELPLGEIQTVIQIVLAKEFATRKEELAKALWTILGYGLGQALKDPSVPKTAFATAGLTDEDAVDVLKTLSAPRADGTDLQIPRALLLWIIQILTERFLK